MAKKERLIVIGGVAAGMSAATKARRLAPDLEIRVFEKSGFVSFGSCGLPYFVGGVIPSHEKLIVRTPEQFAKSNIAVHVHHEVTGIDLQKRTVRVRDLRENREFEEPFDKLVVTTGGSAVRPKLPGIGLPGIFSLRIVEDGLAVRRWLREQNVRAAVIVGGGYIGLEMAEAFRNLGLEVTVLEMLPQVLSNMDADMAALVQDELKYQGVGLYLEHKVEGFEGTDRVRAVVANGREFPADIVLLAVGVRANVKLAAEAGIRIGPTGAVAVNDRQETNVPGVFAAGDVAEAHHLVLNRPVYIPLGTTANKQGRVAGTNVAGGRARFPGIVGTAAVKVFDLEVARTGLTLAEARKEGFDAQETRIKHFAIGHYMPDPTPLHVKLVYDAGSRRLLGAQMVGKQGAAKRIDVIAAALLAKWTVSDLAKLDLSYAPPFAPVWDPILVAANVAGKA